MRLTVCDICGTGLGHPDTAFRLHDPRGFGEDYEVCGTPCLVALIEKVTANVGVPAPKAWV
jgi:hypothetical protein